MAAQVAAHAAKELIDVRKTLVVVVLVCLLGSVQQAPADFLFGSKARLEQTMLPSIGVDVSVRDPVSLYEVTYDLNGMGNRVVQEPRIPVEAGLVVVGFTAPSTGDRKVQEVRFRLDGDERAFDSIPGPRPGENQERWLRSAIRTARNLYRHERDVFSFKPFRTNTSPFMFVVDSTLLACGPHSVDIYLLQDGGDGKGASAIIPFRIVQPVDENGQPVLGEYQRKRLEASRAVAPPMLGDALSPFAGADDFCQVAVRAAASWGYRCRPMDWDRKAQYRWTGDGDAPVIIFTTDGAPHTIEIEWGGARCRPAQTMAGFAADWLPRNTVFSPVIDGQRAGRFMATGNGFWVPCTLGPEGWYVKG
jgi:hypothetical protein